MAQDRQTRGRDTHADICSSLSLFTTEVMPEFQALQPAQEEWKRAVLAGETTAG